VPEQEQPVAQGSESTPEATGANEKKPGKKTPVSKRLLTYVGGAVFTAVLAWAVQYYLPGLLSGGSSTPATQAQAAKSTTTAPIAVDVNDDPSTIDTFAAGSETLLLPTTVRSQHASNPPEGFCSEFRTWALGLGGVDARQTEFRLVVQGNSSLPVVLVGMSAQILRRVPTSQSLPVACATAGNATVRSIQINLDAHPPLADYRSTNGTKPFAFTLNKGDTEIFDVTAVTSEPHTVTEWDLVLDAVIDGKPRTFVIEDRGRPFETAGWPADGTKNTYSWGGGWYPRSPLA
jgi:hypothetical protein